MPRSLPARRRSSHTSPRTSSVRPPMRSRPRVRPRRKERARAQGDSSAGGSATSSRRRFASSYSTTSGCGTTSAGRCSTAERAIALADLARIQTLDPANERLVYRSRHVGGLIEVSGTEDDLRSLAGVIADEVADEASARRRADLKATFDRIYRVGASHAGDRVVGAPLLRRAFQGLVRSAPNPQTTLRAFTLAAIYAYLLMDVAAIDSLTDAWIKVSRQRGAL